MIRSAFENCRPEETFQWSAAFPVLQEDGFEKTALQFSSSIGAFVASTYFSRMTLWNRDGQVGHTP
jgi:hypothetical protein